MDATQTPAAMPSLDDLIRQKAVLDQMIEQTRNASKQADLAKVVAIIKAHGFTPAEVIAATGWTVKQVKAALPKQEVKDKYFVPNADGTITPEGKKWNGRGLQPNAVTEWLAGDKKRKLADLLITKPATTAPAKVGTTKK